MTRTRREQMQRDMAELKRAVAEFDERYPPELLKCDYERTAMRARFDADVEKTKQELESWNDN